jgi:uracil phosphoribosyltransferase
MLFNLSAQNSIANQFILELRNKDIQQDRMRFRKNVERLGEIMAYEISKKLSYNPRSVETPLGDLAVQIIKEQPVLITIMRAGLPYFQGFIDMFDHADVGFVGAYREEKTKEITIKLDYVATPSLKDRVVILIDPMLATGNSVVESLKLMMRQGVPAHVHIASLIAAPEGIEFLKKNVTVPFSLWTCAVDEKLNDQFYIVPGLGDAGDLSYGIKV